VPLAIPSGCRSLARVTMNNSSSRPVAMELIVHGLREEVGMVRPGHHPQPSPDSALKEAFYTRDRNWQYRVAVIRGLRQDLTGHAPQESTQKASGGGRLTACLYPGMSATCSSPYWCRCIDCSREPRYSQDG
jgi:hypothetical protein